MNIKHLLFLFFFLSGLTGIFKLSACELSDLNVDKSVCANDKFYVKINFTYKDASNCFTVTGNGHNYGIFEYTKLPIVIDGLTGDCTTEFEFQITDCNNKQCTISKNIGKVCCVAPPCLISNLRLETLPCDSSGKFFVVLNFNHENTSHCFHLKINDHQYADYEYTSLPIKIGPLEGDCVTNRVFAVYDCDKPDACNAKIGLDKICCPGSCKISNLKIEKTDCDSLHMFNMILSFKAENVSDSFVLKIGDHKIGTFKYGNPGYKIGPLPGDCITKFPIHIIDQRDTLCSTDTIWGPVCCPMPPPPHCELSGLTIMKGDCNQDNQFFVDINFNHNNNSDCFHLYVNNDLFGDFKYSDLPITHIGPFKGDCHTEYAFLIKDCANADCHIDQSIGKVCCGTPPPPCTLSNLDIKRTDCDSNNQFFVKLNFSVNNSSSDGFKIFIGGVLYRDFKYADLPLVIGPFNGDCHTEYNFLIKDDNDPNCSLEYNFGKVCCNTNPPCLLTNLEIIKGDCNGDNQFFVNINFKSNNSSGCFHLYVNNDLYGEFNYANLPLTHIGPFKGDCHTEYVFLVKDCANPDCHVSASIGVVCCNTPPPCQLSALEITKSPCNQDNQFFVDINFNHNNNSDCFHLYVNNDLIGDFKYADLPITHIGPFKGDCQTPYGFLIKDCVNSDCHIDKSIGTVCCGTPPPHCQLTNLVITKSDCDSNNQFTIKLSLVNNNSSDCFHLYVNNDLYGDFKYSDLPLEKIGPFKGDCQTEYGFLVKDCINPDCRIDFSLGKVCCGTPPPCHLSDLHLEKTECGGDHQFFAVINFNHSGTSECFHLTGNGHNYGEFKYGQLPLKIGPLVGDCITNYEFGIEDCVKHDCHISGNLGTVCCDSTSSKYYDFEMTRTDCDSNSMFKVKFNFHYRDVSDSFNILINGISFGTFGYNQLPVSAGPLLADCKTIYKISLIDQKDTTIRINRYIERPCCHTNIEPCSIYDILANPQQCTGPNRYALELNFNHKGTTNKFFDVFDRIGPIGYFSFDSLPITIPDFKQSGHEFDFVKICENDNPQCCSAVEFRTVDCDSLVNNPNKFKISNLIVYTNNGANTIALFSTEEIPQDVQIEMFNLEGRQVPVDAVERQIHEIIIYSNLLATDMYFIRLKSQESTKTYKIFHIK